jgi:hypothetical protein
LQAAWNASAVYSLPRGVEDDAGDRAAAHRHRHGQRAVGRLYALRDRLVAFREELLAYRGEVLHVHG